MNNFPLIPLENLLYRPDVAALANVRLTKHRFWMAKNHRPGAAKLDAARPLIGSGTVANRPQLGPYSRVIDRGAVGGLIDGRSREGRFLRAYERSLTEHVGGAPSIVQRALISRAARLALHLELMDERSLAGNHEFTVHDHNHYVSWSNALGRLLARLGLQPAAAPQPSFEQVLSDIARRRAQPDDAA